VTVTVNSNMTIPDSEHYRSSYLGDSFERLASYREQLVQCMVEPPARSVLVVGKGDGLVPDILRGRGFRVEVLDISPDLGPDIVGSVEAIPCASGSFDIAMCCQVLEHLPFAKLAKAMQELSRVSRRRVIISVPDNRRVLSVQVRFLRWHWRVQLNQMRWPARELPPSRLDVHGHYWEIGFSGCTVGKVLRQLSVPGWRLSKCTRVHDMAWHLFMVFDSQEAQP
jgi:SAM-dependent methyltransferase